MDVEHLILDLASEDYVGLWELQWRYRTKQVEAPAEEIDRELAAALQRLIKQGLVTLSRGTAFAGEEVTLHSTDALVVASDPRQWNPSANGVEHVRLKTTAEGDRRYSEFF